MVNLINKIQTALLNAYLNVRHPARANGAQGALEYIAIAVLIVLVVAGAFTLLGGSLSNVASNLCTRILGGTAGC